MKKNIGYICYLSLGANLGNRDEAIRKALAALDSHDGIQVGKISAMYETPPWGKTDQPVFINAAACVKTSLAPLELLHVCQQVEKALGRVRHEHWGARTIDIDLLYMLKQEEAIHDWLPVAMDTDALRLPHPYMLERAFVMVPLAEIAPELALADGRTAAQVRDSLPDKDTIKPYGKG